MKAAFALGFCLVGVCASAQQPVTVNARVMTRTAGADLQQTFHTILKDQTDAAWVGYAVPVPGNSALRNDGWSERCRLEQTSGAGANAASPAGPVRLEPAPTVMVLFRVQNHEVQKIRTYSSDCQVDAGGLALIWLEALAPAQSVAWLKTFVADITDRTRSESALSAIALHQDPSASEALFDFARNGATRIRERALFWIARRAERRAAATISDAIERDPDAEVKKQAVFALSQLPNSEGVPLLINLARTSGNPTVRKQAFFWLGQSKDPRALTFFEEVLR
jgi:hypothetical protein